MRPVLFFLFPILAAGASTEPQIRGAAARSVALMQRSTAAFVKAQTCFSCHHQGASMMLLKHARAHGVAVDENTAREVALKTFTRDTGNLTSIDSVVQGAYVIDSGMSLGTKLVAAADAGLAPSLVSRAEALRLAGWQREDGGWPVLDQRPPSSQGEISSTAYAIRAIDLYLPEVRKRGSIERAKRWLLTAKPANTEDHVFRLAGLSWAGAPEPDRRKATADLLALQRADGGWAQLPSRSSDAYATGTAMVALAEAGRVPVSDPAWRKGVEYLMRTQKADGSWLVDTRMVSPAEVSPPYFESGFPHARNQFISAAATAWAAAALSVALPKTGTAKPIAVPEVDPVGLKDWMTTALLGTPAELQQLITKGLDPNSATAGGTSLLMLSAHEPEKVRLLLARGANAKAKTKNGFTALMIAASHRGAADSVRQLLKAGAEANPGKGVMFNASPLFFAALTGQHESLRALLDAGADWKRPMLLLGQFPATPLLAAVFQNDTATASELIRRGANVNEIDATGAPPMTWAVIGNRAEMTELLMRSGAKVAQTDKHGFTAAMYAASIDHGDPAILLRLLAAGADRSSALAKAKQFKHASLAQAIERAR